MTVRVTTTPGFAYLADVVIAYRRTAEHGAALGLSEAECRTAIGHRLDIDAQDGRATDWSLLCDQLTALADIKSRKDKRSMTERDYEQWVRDQTFVQARYAAGGVRVEGQVVGYVEQPTLVIRTADGDHVHWIADLTDPVEVTQPADDPKPAPRITLADRTGRRF